MGDYANNAHAIGWDDEITNDGGNFVLLPPGDYNFTVTAFERGRYPGSAKIPACNKAVLTLNVDTPESSASIKYDLILWSSLEWRISEFFRAIGQKKSGEAFTPRWGEVIGSRGRAKFKTRTYTKKDGSIGEVNDVDRFYDYDPANFADKTPSWVADAQKAQAAQPALAWEQGKF